MYLADNIEGKDTVGFFNGAAHMDTSLQNFGYAELKVAKKNSIIQQGLKINCHQFHKSFVALKEETLYTIDKINFDGGHKQWDCGYYKNNTIGTYAHIHFFGNMNFIRNILDK